jgi:hypothetical protein
MGSGQEVLRLGDSDYQKVTETLALSLRSHPSFLILSNSCFSLISAALLQVADFTYFNVKKNTQTA